MLKKLYDPVIDMLRSIAILAVILVHTTTRALEFTSFNLKAEPFTLLLNQIARFTVPLFFMISGYVLELNFHLNESYIVYFKKRVSRILIPYIFWSVVYYCFVYYVNRDPNLLNTFITGSASYQLYFIPSLVIFYLIFPILHKYFHIIGNKYMLMLLAIVQVVLLYIDYYIVPFNMFYPLLICLLNYFVFIFGMWLARHISKVKEFINNNWKLIFVSSLVLGLTIFYEGFSGYLTTQNYLTFYSQWRPSVIIYSITLAGFLYWLFQNKFKLVKLSKLLSKLSFFVFFIHVILLELTWTFIFKFLYSMTGFSVHQLILDPLYFFTVAALSYVLAFIVHKIKILPKITG